MFFILFFVGVFAQLSPAPHDYMALPAAIVTGTLVLIIAFLVMMHYTCKHITGKGVGGRESSLR